MIISARKLVGAAAVVGTAALSMPAHAVFQIAICEQALCAGGGSIVVADNGAGDSSATAGAIVWTNSAFGYDFVLNSALSKPVIGSPAAPQLDLTFSAARTSGTNSIFLYASDTDFTPVGTSFLLSLGGTQGAGASILTRAYGGTGNAGLPFAPVIGVVGPLMTSPTFAGSSSGSFSPTLSPYSLTLGVAINGVSSSPTTGDANLMITPIPEPETYALMLAGLGAIGFMARRRRTR